MQFHIRAQGLVRNAAVVERVRRRLGLALGRFADQVSDVRVTLEDVAGLGGAAKRCSLRAALRGDGEPLFAQDIDRSLLVAIDRSAGRLGRSVARRLRRRRPALRIATRARRTPSP